MTQDPARELRLFSLVALMIAAYGGLVAAFAAANGQLRLLVIEELSGSMAAIWVFAFVFVFAAYAIDLLVRRRPASPIAVMIAEFRAEIWRADWMIARLTVVAGWFCLMVFFTPFKVMIGHVRGFPYDRTFMELDRALFLGTDPWVVTHALFGGPIPTFLLHLAYNMWFVMMWLSVIYFIMRPELARLRARYLTAFLLSWMLVGSLAAYFLASAGPCFYERAFGDGHFRPLMARLHAVDAELQAFWPGLGVHALRLQDILWNSFSAQRELFGGGISAMPSVHVSIAVLMACGAWQIGRRPGWIMTAFAVAIWIGSVHFGWHYALDGIVAAPMTLAIWKLSGWLVDRFVFAEAPRAARPAFG